MLACFRIPPHWFLTLVIFAAHGAFTPKIVAQGAPDQVAETILNNARKAFNEKNYAAASDRFREFLAKFAGHKDAPAARYGLALSLLEITQPNYAEAQKLLQGLTNLKDHPDFPLFHYHLGLAGRGLGMIDLEIAQTKPNEAARRRADASLRFEEAAAAFGEALKGFETRAKKSTADPNQLPLEWEWAARARCEQAEMLLRLQKPQEAQAAAVAFIKDPLLSKSKVRDQGCYYYGFASYLLNEIGPAQRALTTLAPFSDPQFGNHARYLLARAHHLAEERAEATLHYEAVFNEYVVVKKTAKGTALPDHVVRAAFYLGILKFEADNFTEAIGRFAEVARLQPQSPLRTEADMRIGICQVQLRAYPDAIKILAPLVERDPRLSDQVLFWLGKAQAGNADPAKGPDYRKSLQTAHATLQEALNRLQKLKPQDPTSLQRRGQILLEIADNLQNLNQYKEAAAAYTQILRDKLLTAREDEVLHRLVAALHLAGDFDESDRQAKVFQERFPTSILLPAVLFRVAENSYFRTLAKDNTPNAPELPKELAKAYAETAKLLSSFIERYPDFAKVNMARYTLGMIYYRQGDLDKTKETLGKIPADERTGDLALAALIVADCNLRQTPLNTDGLDALEAGKVEDRLKTAVEQLQAFVAGPIHAQTGDALLKLGLAHQRMAALRGQLADKTQQAEKIKSLGLARDVYARLLSKEFSSKDNPFAAQASLELAKCLALSNDINGAIRNLRKFTVDPPVWVVLDPDELKSTGGVKLAKQKDGSILASGPLPTPVTYTIVAKTNLKKITGIRLEVLADPIFPANGPGRASNGNLVLNEFKVYYSRLDGADKPKEASLILPQATFSQNEFPIANAIDNNPATGWAIFPRIGEDHTVVFEVRDKIGYSEGVKLIFTLDQNYPEHSLGKIRISITDAPPPILLEGALSDINLRSSKVAPMAFIYLATLLRSQNKQEEAAALLAKGREMFEASLAKDPERSGWIPLLRYHHGVALRESGKSPEAQVLFQSVVKQVPMRLEGIESALRLGQCLKEEGEKNLEKYRKLTSDGMQPDAEAVRLQNEGYKYLRAAAQFLETQAEQLKALPIGADQRARMLYDAAWAMRLLAKPEVDAARKALAQEFTKKFGPAAGKLPLLEVPFERIPVQPSEQKALDLYKNLIKTYSESPLTTDARFELGELHAQRKEYKLALEQFQEVLDKEPPPDLTDKVRIRLGDVYTAQGNLKGALTQFEAVAQNPKSALFGLAQYGAADVNLANNEVPEAIKRLSLFRSRTDLQNQPGLTDKALLRLGQAYAQAKNWDESRRAHIQLIATFPASPWLEEAYYGIGFTYQQTKQLDQALNFYFFAKVAGRTAAKAQLQIGLCKLEQKKYAEAIAAFMVVPTTYSYYPELSANALLEAAQAHVEATQPKDAIRLLERVIREYPGSVWAKTAEERLKRLTEKK